MRVLIHRNEKTLGFHSSSGSRVAFEKVFIREKYTAGSPLKALGLKIKRVLYEGAHLSKKSFFQALGDES